MDEIQVTKSSIREESKAKLKAFLKEDREHRTGQIVDRFLDFANFLESKIVLLYVSNAYQVGTREILEHAYQLNKLVVLPAFDPRDFSLKLMKVDNPDSDLVRGVRGILEPDPKRCKSVPIASIDIAIIPGIAFDEKGGRIGSGLGYYDRLIPKLIATTRKVSIAFEDQIVPLVPMEAHDRYVDIIITDKRIIYKI